MLTQGKVALVDDADFDRVNTMKWYFHSRVWYAVTNSPRQYYARKKIWMHRFILNAPDGVEVDHVDGNRLNNQRSNLRLCTNSQNRMNQAKRTKKTSSQFKGVTWHTIAKKWAATIRKDGRNIYLGLFHDERMAAQAYDEAAVKLFGEFARPNFPESRRSA